MGQNGGNCNPPCATRSGVHPHRLCQGVVCLQIVVGVGVLTIKAALAGKGDQGGSDRRPLCLGQDHGAEVKGQDVGAGHWVRLN